jgi:hypothetical protein
MIDLPVSARVFEETPGLRALARSAIPPSDGLPFIHVGTDGSSGSFEKRFSRPMTKGLDSHRSRSYNSGYFDHHILIAG